MCILYDPAVILLGMYQGLIFKLFSNCSQGTNQLEQTYTVNDWVGHIGLFHLKINLVYAFERLLHTCMRKLT